MMNNIHVISAPEVIDRSQMLSSDGFLAPASSECDCACPISLSQLEAPPPNLNIFFQDRFICAPELHLTPLTSGYWTAFNPTGKAGVVVLNQSARELLQHFKKPTSPANALAQYDRVQGDAKAALTRLVSLGLLQRSDEVKQPPQVDEGRLLTVWLHITNQCNLRCSYCYLNKTNEHMSEATGRAAVEAVIRSALAEGYPAIKLKYAGGEAALKLERVFDIHDYALSQCQSHGLKLEAVLLSNGTLLKGADIEGLKTRQIRVMISLDGLGQAHDVQRPFLGGQPSARRVVSGIERLTEHSLPPHLSITLTAHNCEQIDEVIRFALERNLTFSLNFYRENDCSASVADLRYDESKMIAGVRQAYRTIEEYLPRWSVLGAVLDRGQLVAPQEHACGVARHYLVIDHKGWISKCHMEMEQVVTDIRHDNPLELIRLSPIGVQNPSALEKEGCRECTWRYWCTGGCPVATYRATGRYDIKSPNCHIYQAIYPEAIRLEGLRLLNYAARPESQLEPA